MKRPSADPTAPRRCAACREETTFPGALCLDCGRMQQRDMPEGYQILTTAPNPARSGYPDCGQRGLRLHIVQAADADTLRSIGSRRALCGTRPSRGWSLDRLMDIPCSQCLRALFRSHPGILEARTSFRRAREAATQAHAARRAKFDATIAAADALIAAGAEIDSRKALE